MKQKMIQVTGWSYPPESLRHLGDAIADEFDVQSLHHSALIAKSNLASLFPCSPFARGLIAECARVAEASGHAVAQTQLAAYRNQLTEKGSSLVASLTLLSRTSVKAMLDAPSHTRSAINFVCPSRLW